MARTPKKPKPLPLSKRCLIAEDPATAGPGRDLCDKCGLHNEAKRPFMQATVPPRWTGELYVLGEGAGADEDNRTGRQFTGKSGQIIREELQRAGVPEEDVIWDNIVKCRPPGNATPSMEQIRCCRPFLLWNLEHYRPRAVLALGTSAAKGLTNDGQATVTALRGRLLEIPGLKGEADAGV